MPTGRSVARRTIVDRRLVLLARHRNSGAGRSTDAGGARAAEAVPVGDGVGNPVDATISLGIPLGANEHLVRVRPRCSQLRVRQNVVLSRPRGWTARGLM